MFKDKQQQRDFQRNWCAARRAEYISLRGGCCEECAAVVNLEFHHRELSTKIDHKIWFWRRERIDVEISKYDLLCRDCRDCRDCHAKETAKERGYGLAPHGTLTAYKSYECRCQDCRKANAEYEHSRRLKGHTYTKADSLLSDTGGSTPSSPPFPQTAFANAMCGDD